MLKKNMSEQHMIVMFNRQDFKAHANNVLLWLWINAVSRECNSTAELIFDVNICRIVQWIRKNCN